MEHKQSLDAYIKLRNKDYYAKIYKFFADYSVQDVLDVGCASGDFVFQGPQTISWTGLDVSSDLIELAKGSRSRKNIRYRVGNIMDESSFISNGLLDKYDAVTLLGTLSTIEDGAMALRRCLSKVKKLFVFQGVLNPYNFDVLVGHKTSGISPVEYMYSHNMLSVNTLKMVLSEYGFEIVHNEEYVPEVKLECNQSRISLKALRLQLIIKEPSLII